MKAYAILAACLTLAGAAPAQAFFHGGGGRPGPHFGGHGHFPVHGYHGYGLLDGILASGVYPPGDYAAPEPRPEPQLVPVPVPVPVPVSAPQLRAPEGSGPRIIYLGHEPSRRDLPKVIYGTP